MVKCHPVREYTTTKFELFMEGEKNILLPNDRKQEFGNNALKTMVYKKSNGKR